MSARRDFGLRLGAAILAMFLLAPLFGALFPNEPFHRVMTRVLQVSLVVALLARRGMFRGLGPKVRAVGLRGPDRRLRLAAGAGTALALMALVLLLSWALGGRPLHAREHHLPLLLHLLRSCAAGLAVGLFEELLCRGYLKDALGNPLSAFVFAAAHFFRPLQGSRPAGEGYDPLLAFKRIGSMVESWTESRLATLGLASLWFFGMALNRMRDRTGSLYLGIGFHAGLVFALDFYRRHLEAVTPGDPWIFGGSRLHDGLIGTVMLALVWLWADRGPIPATLRRQGP